MNFEGARSVKACRSRTHKGDCMRFATHSRPARCSGCNTQIVRRDGAKRHFEARVSPPTSGQLLYVTRDMTELRRREREVHILQRALEADGAMPICVADARTLYRPIVYVNTAFERLTGYPRHELLVRDGRLPKGAETSEPGSSRRARRSPRRRPHHHAAQRVRRDGSAVVYGTQHPAGAQRKRGPDACHRRRDRRHATHRGRRAARVQRAAHRSAATAIT